MIRSDTLSSTPAKRFAQSAQVLLGALCFTFGSNPALSEFRSTELSGPGSRSAEQYRASPRQNQVQPPPLVSSGMSTALVSSGMHTALSAPHAALSQPDAPAFSHQHLTYSRKKPWIKLSPEGELFRSNDQGSSWQKSVLTGTKAVRITGFYFALSGEGYAFSNNLALFRSSDRGRSWHPVHQDKAGEYPNSVTTSSGELLMIGHQGKGVISFDRGLSWLQLAAQPVDTSPPGIHPPNGWNPMLLGQ